MSFDEVIMKIIFILLTIYVALLRADRSALPNLGAPRSLVLPDLGTAQSFLPASFSNAKNVHVKVTTRKHSSQPQTFRHSHNVTPEGTVDFSNKNNTEGLSFIPLNVDAGVSLDSANFFEKNLHEAGEHVPPFPIIPFNSLNKKSHAENSFYNTFPNTGKGSNQVFPSPAVPQPFNINGNVHTGFPHQTGQTFNNNPQIYPEVNYPSTVPSNHQGGASSYPEVNNTPTYPDTAIDGHEVTIPVVNDFTQPPLTHHIVPDFPSRNEVAIDNRNQFIQPPIDQHQQDQERFEDTLEREWSEFRTRFNKVYETVEEERFRREVFSENRDKIQRLNTDYAEGRRNFVHRINPYADLLLHEFTNQHCGFNQSRSTPRHPIKPASAFVPSANVVFPSSVDWREVGAVGPVKTQGKCAACWAFAAAGALEGHHFRKTGNLEDISVQNLIDCTEPYGNNGCSGGLMDPAFEYVRDNNGVDSEQSYPFEERTAECRFRRENVVASCTGFVDIGENDERGLQIALATLGPVTAAIDAAKETFQFYSEGVYDDPQCGNTPDKMNHAVLIVGYGTDPDGKKYWLVKNSYGPQWGIGGYIKIAKDNNNQCGIAIQASYPLV